MTAMNPLDWFRAKKPLPPKTQPTRVSSGRPPEVIRLGKNGAVKR